MKIGEMFTKMKKDPKKAAKAADKMIDKIDDGTDEIEVPEEMAFLFDEFDAMGENDKLSEKSMEFIKKHHSLKDIASLVKKYGKKKTVKVSRTKIKSATKKGCKKIAETDDATLNKESVEEEEISLLAEPTNEAIELVAFGIASTFIFAWEIFCIYVVIKAATTGSMDIFKKDDSPSTAGSIAGSLFFGLFLTGIYCIIAYIKMKQKENGTKKNESVNEEDDSILATMTESDSSVTANPSTCFDKAHEPNHNGDLLAAYRMVINDLSSRVGNNSDPTK